MYAPLNILFFPHNKFQLTRLRRKHLDSLRSFDDRLNSHKRIESRSIVNDFCVNDRRIELRKLVYSAAKRYADTWRVEKEIPVGGQSFYRDGNIFEHPLGNRFDRYFYINRIR